MIENLPAVWETRFNPRVRKNPLGKKRATHSNILAWIIPWTKEQVCGLQSMRSQIERHD